MHTINIALPESMKQFVLEQVTQGDYRSPSEYIRDLIQADQKEKARSTLEQEIIAGLESGESSPMTQERWQQIRAKVAQQHVLRSEQ